MEQETSLSINQAKKLGDKRQKNYEKKKNRKKYSSASRGKVIVGVIDNEESKQLEKIKSLVSRYKEIIFNQCEKISEFMNSIEDENNELLILRKQLIRNNLLTEEQLQMQSQQNFKYSQSMEIEKIQYNSQNKKEKDEESKKIIKKNRKA